MSTLRIRFSLFINYFVFAILLNSVGVVILQLQRNLGLDKGEVSVLEAFKDLPIAIASFVVASFLPKLGIKKGMLIGMVVVGLACLCMPVIASDFWHYKVLFATVGVTFAIIKISVFSTIGLISRDDKDHRSLMSWIEGFFMIGVLFGNLLISLFIDEVNPKSTEWLNVYYLLAGLCLVAVGLLAVSPLDESGALRADNKIKDDFFDMLRLMVKPLILIFVICAFLFVLIEQSFQTWTPTFYNDMLKVPAKMSVQAGSILAGAFAMGRILSGFVLRKISWLPFTLLCLAVLAACVAINIPLANAATVTKDVSWTDAPLIVYIFPLMGVFLAPIYPTINSVILTAIPKYLHSAMSGLIVVFSALGGTFGSIITGTIFERFDGYTAFYMSLVPMGLLAVSLILLARFLKSKTAAI
jgi:fucose permease